MIPINLGAIVRPNGWDARVATLLANLSGMPADDRSVYIDECREETWAHPDLLSALRELVGNKCWYSEVPLEGADPNVDHFRPKGRVKEVDENLQPTKNLLPGYWWWAFDWRNFRLAAMHSNQRRVDLETDGGKADFFPVSGARAVPGSDYAICVEDVIPIDPCKHTDVALLWFDADGTPTCSAWKRTKSKEDEWRVKVSIWLYHLDKREIVSRRREHMDQMRAELLNADTDYRLWKSAEGNVISKNSFETRLNTIKALISSKSEFSGAKRAAIKAASAQYTWIDEFGLV